jgi:hypothetical protein
VENVVRIEGTRNVEVYKFWSENQKYKEHSEKNVGIVGRIILKWIFKRGVGLIQLAHIETSSGPFLLRQWLSCFRTIKKFHDQLRSH